MQYKKEEGILSQCRERYGPLVDIVKIHQSPIKDRRYSLSAELSFQKTITIDTSGGYGAHSERPFGYLISDIHKQVEQVVLSRCGTMPHTPSIDHILRGADVRCTHNIPENFVIMAPKLYYMLVDADNAGI